MYLSGNTPQGHSTEEMEDLVKVPRAGALGFKKEVKAVKTNKLFGLFRGNKSNKNNNFEDVFKALDEKNTDLFSELFERNAKMLNDYEFSLGNS